MIAAHVCIVRVYIYKLNEEKSMWHGLNVFVWLVFFFYICFSHTDDDDDDDNVN